jgi:pimeloyl-ACP methyl ester carboxylesterase
MDPRTHHVTTTDRVTIGGTVHGDGPPLVFVHGIMGDGDLDFQAVVPHLTGRFTCHLPSWRGRGLSGDDPDLRFGRMVDDLIAYLDSLGTTAGVVGWSAGADLALAVAAQSDAVDSVAALEPSMPRLLTEEQRGAFGAAFARMGELATVGRLTDAMRAFAAVPFTNDELALLEDTGYLEATARYVPNLLGIIQQQADHEWPLPDDPDVLGAISAPVLVLCGSNSKPLAIRAAEHVVEHVPHARTHHISDTGHVAPLARPEALAEALTDFLCPAQEPA